MSDLRTPTRYLAKRPTDTGTIAGEGAQIPVVYGIDRRQALISSITDAGDKVIFVCVWSVGEIDAITGLTINDKPVPDETGYAVRHYTGTDGQGVDAGLKAVRPDYADTLTMSLGGESVAIAYSVVEIPASVDFPVIAATIRGRKVHDPRTNITAWSDNPALCLADYIQSKTYGQGWLASNIAAAANACDELVGGQHRRKIGLSVNTGRGTSKEQWVETLRNYAGCFVAPEGAYRKLVPDRPTASVKTFTDADIAPGSLSIDIDQVQSVTVSRVTWTDTSGLPWREGVAVAYASGVQIGDVEWIEETASLPGIQRGEQALREAQERLGAVEYGSKTVKLASYDEALALQMGDVVTLNQPGASGDFRIMTVSSNSPGRYQVEARSYDAAIYSNASAFDEIISAPIAPRSDSIDEPNIGGITSGGGTYVEGGDGTIFNRVRVDLAPPANSPDFSHFEVRFKPVEGDAPYQEGYVTGTTAYLQPVQDGIAYEFDTRSVGRGGAKSPWATSTHTVEKKNVPPPKPTNLSVSVSASGTRTVSFSYANQPADFAGFRVQYDGGSGYVDLLDGLTSRQSIETEKMPSGNVTIRVHAQDTSKNTSGWLYKTSNIEQGADGKWYDVDARIAAEKVRNDGQDGDLNYQSGTLIPDAKQTGTDANNNANNIKFNVIPPIRSTAGSAYNTGNYLQDTVIPPIQSTANTAKGTANTLKNTTVPAVKWTADNGKSTADYLQITKIPAVEGTVSSAQNTANEAETKADDSQSRLPAVESGVDYSSWKIPIVESAASTAQNAADTAQNAANTAQGGVNSIESEMSGPVGLRFVSGDAQATAYSALSRANQAYATATAGQVDGHRLISNTITFDKLNILNLGAISANIGTVTAGRLQGNARSLNLDSGDFINSNSKFRVTGTGTVYANDLYVWGTWPTAHHDAGGGCTYFTGYKKVDDVFTANVDCNYYGEA